MNVALAILALFAQLWPNPGPGRAAPGGGGSDVDVITAYSSSSSGTSSSSTCLGWSFNVNSNISVTKLWREVLTGDAAAHLLVLADSGGTTLGSCTVDPSGQTVGVRQSCTLGSPVNLTNADTGVRIMQQRVSGDPYKNLTSLTTTAAVTKGSAIAGTASGTACTGVSGYDVADASSGPVGVLYQ
jgi:hypothetical protein